MPQYFDLIVIGSGPAGRPAAVQAAKLKKSPARSAEYESRHQNSPQLEFRHA
jgi:pyruvate/2-oxoglutarate dehydrogenase complex dihydrolipoamide dehydrogenase (E3) component